MPNLIVSLGQNGTRLVSEGIVGDPHTGYRLRQVYESDNYASLYVQTITLPQGGAATTELQQVIGTPMWQLTITWNSFQPTGFDEYTERFEFTTEFIQEDIFNSPSVVEYLGGELDAVIVRIDVKEAMKLDLTLAQYAVQISASLKSQEMYSLYLRGLRAVEVERPVVRRVRVTQRGFNGRTIPNAIPEVYSTATLIAMLNMPAYEATRLAEPYYEAPPYSTWGWKKRQDTSVVDVAKNRVEEVKDFVFAAWYNISHVFIV